MKLVHGTKVIEVTPDRLNEVQLPVPPLEVQREIVRILDSFTSFTAELIARKKQYEYYRNKLLVYEKTIPGEKLGVTCEMKAGKAISSHLISAQETQDTSIKCYGENSYSIICTVFYR